MKKPKMDDILKPEAKRSSAEELNEIGISCSQLPDISALTDDEILGNDEFGVPSSGEKRFSSLEIHQRVFADGVPQRRTVTEMREGIQA